MFLLSSWQRSMSGSSLMFLVVPFSAWLGLTPPPSDTPHLPSHRGSDVEVKDLLKGDLVDFAHYEERLTVPGTHWATPPNLDGTDGWDGPDDGWLVTDLRDGKLKARLVFIKGCWWPRRGKKDKKRFWKGALMCIE